jgi:hypothetical protein
LTSQLEIKRGRGGRGSILVSIYQCEGTNAKPDDVLWRVPGADGARLYNLGRRKGATQPVSPNI